MRFPTDTRLLVLACLALVAGACGGDERARDPIERPQVGPESVWMDGRRSTSPEVAAGNLDARIDALRARVTERPSDLAARAGGAWVDPSQIVPVPNPATAGGSG